MSKSRILCVDDDIVTLNTLEDILTSADFDVSLAKSASQAMKVLEKGIRCNLILLDIDMPGINGYDAFTRIRQIPGCEKIPIIFLTGMDSPDFEIRGLEIGACDYISKPFFKNVLIARIKGQLRNSSNDTSDANVLYNEETLRLFKKELNDSEIIIARHIADGLSNQEIADLTHYSYNYVKKMTSSILSKLNLTKRSEIRQMLKS